MPKKCGKRYQNSVDTKLIYHQGVSSPHNRSINGDALPSPRLISMNVFSDSDRPLKPYTSLFMQFGQFINHDLESTSQFTFRIFQK